LVFNSSWLKRLFFLDYLDDGLIILVLVLWLWFDILSVVTLLELFRCWPIALRLTTLLLFNIMLREDFIKIRYTNIG